MKTAWSDKTVIGLEKDYRAYVGSLAILDVACCYLLLFSLYININMGKIVVNVKLVGDNLYGK